MQHEALLSTAEAAELLGVDRSTVSRWVAAGHITPALQGKGENAPMFFAIEDVKTVKAKTVTVRRRRLNTKAAS